MVLFLSLNADINECESKEGKVCEQICENYDGSFSCQCEEGFTLDDDNYSCTGRFICLSFWLALNSLFVMS